MLKIDKIYLNYAKLQKDFRYRISDTPTPVFSWAVFSSRGGAVQGAYQIAVSFGATLLWDSGKIESGAQKAAYAGTPLPSGEKLCIELVVWDELGEQSLPYCDYFYNGAMDSWEADWITHIDDTGGRSPLIFKKELEISGEIMSACLFVCGLGYHKIEINGIRADPSMLSPAWADYSKTCYYAVLPEIAGLLKQGKNEIEITVADGWRNIDSAFVKRHLGERGIAFGGPKQLSASLNLRQKGGETKTIQTDSDWKVCVDTSRSSNIYDGECLDMTKASEKIYKNAIKTAAPGGNMRAQALSPICQMTRYRAQSIYSPAPGIYVADFGQNMAGQARLELPKNLKKGQKITIRFAEVKNEDGTINTAPLREAKCTDTYIAAGSGQDLSEWQPEFTFHGFRYAQIEGLAILSREQISAVSLYTDIDSDAIFECGDAQASKIHKNAVMTERSNMHSVLTDCPQRDERMGWLNDATVRFEATPYNFEIGQMFPKIVRDVMDAQGGDGAITCTAPYVFGSRPADPVCSSFLIAANEALMHTGNADIIGEAYERFVAWEEFLLGRSEGHIVNYSYYGDWASPAYACDRPDGANSAVTPGILMSTGYSYLNSRLISKFAGLLKKGDDEKKYADIAEKIKAAFLDKWFDKNTARVATGSQACQAFALWLGLVPPEYEQKAAKMLRDDLVESGYRITTGNLCTRYLFDMLAKYGYIDVAYQLVTRQAYPSFGYMIQNEATTIWERFELKLDPGMNSHNHPMYGAIDYWFYAYIAGIRPTSPGFGEFAVEPHYPSGLLSCSAVVDTILGDITVRWIRQYKKLWLYVSVPFGSFANVKTGAGYQRVGAGSHRFLIES